MYYDKNVLWHECIVTKMYYDMNVLWQKCIMTWMYYDKNVLWQECITTWMYYDMNVLWQECIMTWMYYDKNVLWHECIMTWMYYDNVLWQECIMTKITKLRKVVVESCSMFWRSRVRISAKKRAIPASVFVVFLRPSRHVSRRCLQLHYKHILPRPFQFIIQYSSYYPNPYIRGDNQALRDRCGLAICTIISRQLTCT